MQGEASKQVWPILSRALAVGVCSVALVAVCMMGSADLEAKFSEPEVDDFIENMVNEHGFDADFLYGVFSRTVYRQNIIDAISRPAEGKPWSEYRQIFVTKSRIKQGVEFLNQYADTLKRAEAEYGVPVEVIGAIIGVETRFGRNMGSFRTLDALSTLGFYYPPRKKFFKKELREFLIMAREEQRDPSSMLSSYAGAMGFPQFMPSSFRAYAVDFNGDGRRDFWSNPIDAIGSVANYLSRHGWRKGDPVTFRAEGVPASADEIPNAGMKPKMTLGELASAGVRIPLQQSPDTPASLIRLDGKGGTEYWVGLRNFHVIMTYNRSRLYAMAVHQLSQELLNAR